MSHVPDADYLEQAADCLFKGDRGDSHIVAQALVAIGAELRLIREAICQAVKTQSAPSLGELMTSFVAHALAEPTNATPVPLCPDCGSMRLPDETPCLICELKKDDGETHDE